MLNVIQDSDIRMIQGHSSEEILKESRELIETNGEWELVDIKLTSKTVVLDEGNFSKIIYYVSTYKVNKVHFYSNSTLYATVFMSINYIYSWPTTVDLIQQVNGKYINDLTFWRLIPVPQNWFFCLCNTIPVDACNEWFFFFFFLPNEVVTPVNPETCANLCCMCEGEIKILTVNILVRN